MCEWFKRKRHDRCYQGECEGMYLTWIYGDVGHSSEFWVHGDDLVVHVLTEVLSDGISQLSNALMVRGEK